MIFIIHELEIKIVFLYVGSEFTQFHDYYLYIKNMFSKL